MSSRWSSSSCASSGTLAFLAASWVPASRSALISERVISTRDPSPIRVGILGSNGITSVLHPDRPFAAWRPRRSERFHECAKRIDRCCVCCADLRAQLYSRAVGGRYRADGGAKVEPAGGVEPPTCRFEFAHPALSAAVGGNRVFAGRRPGRPP